MIESIKELKAKLESEIKKSSKVFIVGHNSPDFDAIGSAIGLYVLAEYYGKKAFIVVDDDITKIEPGVKKIMDSSKEDFRFITKETFLKKTNANSLLIVTDVNKSHMISLGDCLDQVGHIIVIDHHSEDETTIETKDKYISQEASSASEIVTRVLTLGKVPYDPNVANFLLSGISLDTKRFKQNTTDKTHEVAEKLIRNGADIDFVNNLFLEEFESYCRISNLIINGTMIKKYSESQLAPIQVSFTLDRNHPSQIYAKEDYAKAADRMMKFTGIDASFALGFVEPGIVHISARSGKRINVGSIMKEMGGGGNAQSAGGRMETGDIFGIEEELMQKVQVGIPEEIDVIGEPPIIKVKQIKKN